MFTCNVTYPTPTPHSCIPLYMPQHFFMSVLDLATGKTLDMIGTNKTLEQDVFVRQQEKKKHLST